MKARWRVWAGAAKQPRTWWVAPMCGLVVALASALCTLSLVPDPLGAQILDVL